MGNNPLQASKFRTSFVIAATAVAALLGGCSTIGTLDSPLRSKDNANTNLFKSPDSMDACVKNLDACVDEARVPVGTAKPQVFDLLGLDPAACINLNKQQIQNVIYGTTLTVPFEQRDSAQSFMNSLEGYSCSYRQVDADKKFGLTGSQIQSHGTTLTFNLVFQNGKLFNKVTAQGENINQMRREGYFSNFTLPGFFGGFKK